MKQVFTVSEVNSYIKTMFIRDYALSNLYIKGEVSNCKYHTSGHIYFTLKDSQGQIACVMFAGQRKGLTFQLAQGQSVIALGSMNVYERDGKYQLYAKEIVLDGAGVLYERFEQLKKKLQEEGLFEAKHKKPIPQYAKKIGIVTAKTGAAIQDICNITNRRNPYVQLVLFPVLVQGEAASQTIVRGIQQLDAMGLDVLIVGRGGGSIEDLWAFNEENVARAIYDAKTPIISAVGHETDVTISDFVADLRAPTPSAAAELAVKELSYIYDLMNGYQANLYQKMTRKITWYRKEIEKWSLQLSYANPMYQIRQKRQHLMDSETKLGQAMEQILMKQRHKLQLYMERLEGRSPIKQLNRGYALVRSVSVKDGEETTTKESVVKSIEAVKVSDTIQISVADGDITATVNGKKRIKRV